MRSVIYKETKKTQSEDPQRMRKISSSKPTESHVIDHEMNNRNNDYFGETGEHQENMLRDPKLIN